MNMYFLIAAVAGAAIALIHMIGGGQTAARPLLESGLADNPKFTNYYAWHIVTIVLIAMSAGYLMAAFNASHTNLAVMMTLLNAAFALWSVLLIVWKRQPIWELPQWVLFLPVAVIGALGIWLG